MKKILIIRQSAIGDIVFASPFAAAVKKSHPGCHLAWLVERGNEVLLADSPWVDECIAIPAGDWRRDWREGRKLNVIKEMRAFGRTLKERRFDTAIDLQGLLKSGLMTWLSGARRRIGLGSREGSRFLMTEVVPRGGQPGRIGSEYLALAEHLGLDVGNFIPELYVNAEAEQQALAKLAERGVAPRNYCVFAAFTTRPQKHWFVDHWQALSVQIKALGLTPVLLGGPGDLQASLTITGNAPELVNMVGEMPLAESMAIIKNAGAVIGVDTGLTHMGIAFAVPTVAIFGSTCPYRDTRRTNSRVIWLGMACSPCRRHPTCDGAFTCLANITPPRVISELQCLLESPL